MYNGSETIDILGVSKKTDLEKIDEMYEFAVIGTELAAQSDGAKALRAYPKTFKVDLLIIDITLGPFWLGFLKQFNYPPTVGVTAFSYPPYLVHFVGGHRALSYVPHYSLKYPNDMTLSQRITNHVVQWYEDYVHLSRFIPMQDKLMHDVFGRNLPSIWDLYEHIGLLLTNTHFSVETMAPFPPNVIPVGGLQIRDPQPLTDDVKAFIDAGKKGSVIFSLGTNVKSDTLDKTVIQMFLNVFKELPEYNFIWKYESNLDLTIPKNVKLQGWMRQSDILAHPNIKAFISHCGLLGTQEAMWHGVPIVGIPFLADQFRNVISLVRAGMAVQIDINTITHEIFKKALVEVLENRAYLTNAKQRASLFKDQIDKPLDRAVFWLEWAIRHKDDMKLIESPVKRVGWFIGNGYDVLLIVTLPVILLLHVVIFLLWKCLWTTTKEKKD